MLPNMPIIILLPITMMEDFGINRIPTGAMVMTTTVMTVAMAVAATDRIHGIGRVLIEFQAKR